MCPGSRIRGVWNVDSHRGNGTGDPSRAPFGNRNTPPDSVAGASRRDESSLDDLAQLNLLLAASHNFIPLV